MPLRAPLRVLVGDDVADVRELLRVTLDLAGGFDVVAEAADGAETVRLAAQHQPDLVVLDVAMPVMNGLEAIGAIRAASPDSRIAVFSVLAIDQLAHEVSARGADLCISKGVPADTLVDALRRLATAPSAEPGSAGLPFEVDLRDPRHPSSLDLDTPPVGTGAQGNGPNSPLELGDVGDDWMVAALEEANWGWEAAFDGAAVGMAVISTDSQILRVNAEACRIWQRNASDIIGRKTRQFVHPDDLPVYDAAVAGLRDGGTDELRAEVRMLRPDGTTRWVALTSSVVTGPDGGGAYVFGQMLDIDRVRRAEHQFRVAFDHAPIGMALIGPDGRLASVNPALCDLLGSGADELVGRLGSSLVATIDTPADPAADAKERAHEVEIVRADGRTLWCLVSVADLEPDTGSSRIVQVMDVTERRHALAQLAHQAAHDPLTGLANRALLMRECDMALSRAERSDSSIALLFCDLDGLKHVNDVHGHAAGDEMLIEVARRLQAAVRPSDTVARHGGDEFVILLEGVSGPAAAAHAAQRVVGAVHEALRLGITEAEPEGIAVVQPSVSVGIAVAGDGPSADTPAGLMSRADAAMYRAKQAGGNRWSS